jgi:hypothetical protein
MDLLLELANELGQKGDFGLFWRESINQTENRAVLHTALQKESAVVCVNGKKYSSWGLWCKKKDTILFEWNIAGGRTGLQGSLLLILQILVSEVLIWVLQWRLSAPIFKSS